MTGAEGWHINADEPDVLDYDTSFKPPAQDALYEPNAYWTSDHDPVIVGLIPIYEIAPHRIDEKAGISPAFLIREQLLALFVARRLCTPETWNLEPTSRTPAG